MWVQVILRLWWRNKCLCVWLFEIINSIFEIHSKFLTDQDIYVYSLVGVRVILRLRWLCDKINADVYDFFKIMNSIFKIHSKFLTVQDTLVKKWYLYTYRWELEWSRDFGNEINTDAYDFFKIMDSIFEIYSKFLTDQDAS